MNQNGVTQVVHLIGQNVDSGNLATRMQDLVDLALVPVASYEMCRGELSDDIID
nr:hypothetical protein [Arthrobacter sp. JZ12]